MADVDQDGQRNPDQPADTGDEDQKGEADVDQDQQDQGPEQREEAAQDGAVGAQDRDRLVQVAVGDGPGQGGPFSHTTGKLIRELVLHIKKPNARQGGGNLCLYLIRLHVGPLN